jgi:spermidine/putrescine-binding protein
MSRDPFGDLSFGEALNRRRFLLRAGAGATLLAAAPILSACGSGGSTAASSGGEVGGEFDLYTWQGFEAPESTKAWLKKNNVDLRVSYVGTQDDVQVKVKSPTGAGLDMSTVNQSYNNYYNELGILSPITKDELPVLNDLFPSFTGKPWENEDGTYNSIPYSFSWNGLVYSPERVKFKTVDTWDILLDPSMKGRVAVWDDAYFGMQLAGVILGFNPDKMTQAQFGTVKSWLAELRPQVKAFSPSVGDFTTLIGNGEVDAVYNAWRATPIYDEGLPCKAVIPKEGAIGTLDSMFIPPKADNRATALAWAEMLLSTKMGAEAQESFAGAATTKKVASLLSPEARKLYPYDNLEGLIARLGMPEGFPRGESEFVTAEEVIEAWQEFKAS